MQRLFEKAGKGIPYGKRGSRPIRLVWQRNYLISCRKDDALLSEAEIIENPGGMGKQKGIRNRGIGKL
jgi:hypothetical protein